MKQYNVLHTIEGGGPGGAETVLLQLASKLDPSRFRSLVLLTSDDWLRQQLVNRGIQTTLVESKAWHDFRLPRAMANLIRQEKVDLIHSHLPGQNFYSCLVGHPLGRRVIVTYHGFPRAYETSGLKGAIRSRVVRRWAAAVVAVSDSLRRALQDLGFPSEKLMRIYNGVETGRFSSSTHGRLREELRCPPQAKLIGMVANMRESKGYEYFVRAARLVADSIPESRFVAVGQIDQKLNVGLSSLVRELCLEDHFSFLGFREDVPEILSDLDAFVLTSVSEGFSLSTVEAMAAGKPIVATLCGGPQEIIEDGYTGLLVPPAASEALAASICRLLRDPDYAATLGQNARRRAERDFALPRMVSEYEILYRRCLNVA